MMALQRVLFGESKKLFPNLLLLRAVRERERESWLQEVKRARLSSKNRISSSSWRLKEMQVLEGRL